MSGEYFVLDGALALAIPTKYGQSLEVETHQDSPYLTWQSLDDEGNVWFECVFDISKKLSIIKTTDENTSDTLVKMLHYVQELNPDFLVPSTNGLLVKTTLEFPRNWGLGSSSTLICTIAQWGKVDAFQLSNNTLGGSGYDIACGTNDTPIFYQRQSPPVITPITFNPSFANHLYFVHLGKKQNSREGIARYRAKAKMNNLPIDSISEISKEMATTASLSTFETLIEEHENLVSTATQLSRAKDLYFQDFEGQIKSLGAWGGDFVMVTSTTSTEKTIQYFKQKGFNICIPFHQMMF